MRLLLIALIVAALVVPTAVLAGSSSSTSGAATASSATADRNGTTKKKRQKRKGRASQRPTAKAAEQKPATHKASISSDEREVKGTISALGATIDVGSVSCSIPAGANLSAVAVGDLVEMTCRSVGGVLTLARVKKEHADDDEREVKGTIEAFTAGGVTVAGTTCAIPAGVVLAGFAVGDLVEIECALVAGVLTLTTLESEDVDHSHADDDHDDGDEQDDE